MPYKKTLELPCGDTGEHLEIGYFHVDYLAKTSSAHLHLWKTKGHKDRGCPPQHQTVAKIRVDGALFDHYLSDDVIAKAKTSHRDQFYAAAKGHPAETVTSDYQPHPDLCARLGTTFTPLLSGGEDV